jgi:hypothetical protein
MIETLATCKESLYAALQEATPSGEVRRMAARLGAKI